ncbi:MAG: YigZ family protein [Candidatus Thermoplasmatota archaeon]|nr:YigZ family protein [Candidatus Thermoplasmatota archaeon]
MEELRAVKFTETRSRFFAHLYLIDSPGEVNIILKKHRKEYRKANHHCFAVRFKDEEGILTEQCKDDGEVGHPGKVLLDLLQKREMGSHVLIVSRIFGGVKLGTGGVSRAFRAAGEGVLDMTYIRSQMSE